MPEPVYSIYKEANERSGQLLIHLNRMGVRRGALHQHGNRR